MAVFTPVGPSSSATLNVNTKQTLVITSVTMDSVIGNETLVTIPAGTKSFTLKVKSAGNSADSLKIATTSGNTLTDNHFDLMAGSIWKEDLLTGSVPVNLYISSTKASTIVQLMLWS